MRATEKTYYSLTRLHRWMALSSLALLGVTVWLLVADYRQTWKEYQRGFKEQVDQRGPGEKLLDLPIVDALGRPLAIEQIYLPDLPLDFHFRKVPRFDRCVTCHLGIDRTMPEGTPQPYCSHPRPELYVGAGSPHPMNRFGCTVCHEGQGSATDFTWASHSPNGPRERSRWRDEHGWFRNPHWEHPMLPARFAESRCLRCHHDVTDLEPSERFRDPPAAKLLAGYHLVREHGCFGCHEISGYDVDGRRVGPDMRLEPAGTMRKVGPTLRDLPESLRPEVLLDWIRDPTNFRPTTRMPRFYGLHEHLGPEALAVARRFEPVEIRAVAEYLRAAAEPVELLEPPTEQGPVAEPSAERGKRLFQTQGCLACHRHADFPEGEGTQGPDLSNVGSKYTDAGWLASWLRDPHRHSPQTLMPNPLLEPSPAGPDDKATDPAADVAAYLFGGSSGWEPKPLPAVDEQDVDALAEVFDVGTEELAAMTLDEKLREVGRRAIGQRGCYGCHDVPGFEHAQPIGPALSDWGRKREELLAFEQVERFVEEGQSVQSSTGPRPVARQEDGQVAQGHGPGAHATAEGTDAAFYRHAIRERRREGFAWQKLRSPRSFDFEVAADKPYDQWLTMGRFTLAPHQREAVVTFLLALVADPPPAPYVYQPGPRRRAIVEGRRVLDKYACDTCHTLEMERWTIEYDPEEFDEPVPVGGFEFMRPEVPAEEIAASLTTDDRGLARADLVGMPQLDEDGELLVVDDDEDEQGNEIYLYAFTLWEPVAIGGEVWPVGGADVLVWGPQIVARRPAWGGTFARLLYPIALDRARESGAAVAGPEARGWLPPPLVGEGSKVHPAWLHDYLLAPRAIRPACLLRMPRYNMSSEEAGKLAGYFAAAAGAEFPYSPVTISLGGDPEQDDAERLARYDAAMRIVTDGKTYCAKCHLIGSAGPGGDVFTILAPDLERVTGRLRPGYLRRWLANPKAVLPYTPMPVNFPPGNQPLDPAICPGESIEHLEAVKDLLLDYDWYLRKKMGRQKDGRQENGGQENGRQEDGGQEDGMARNGMTK